MSQDYNNRRGGRRDDGGYRYDRRDDGRRDEGRRDDYLDNEDGGYNRGGSSRYNRNNNYRGGDNRDYRNGNGNGNRRNYNRDYRNDDAAGTSSQHREEEPNVEELVSEMQNVAPLTPEEMQLREDAQVPIEIFDDLVPQVDLKIIRGVMSYGFEYPSEIQKKAIRPLLSGYDVIAQAQSGTGKTAAFCIGTLGNINFEKNETQAVVLAHTLELAQQIEFVFQNICKYVEARISLAIRSIPVKENIEMLNGTSNANGLVPHIVIGTPGRVLDMLNKKAISSNTVKLIILDEADELLSDGFAVQIKDIISALSHEVQIGLFSATMNANFFRITQKFMRNPINILIKRENLTLEGIKQFYINVEHNDYKFETLCDLYSLLTISQSIIYCNHFKSVENLTRKMQDKNFTVSCIHGNMAVKEREQTMADFRNGKTRVLIATDLLGRGIDVQQVSIVINYDIPLKNESYIHRIGRSGRHGKKGTAINFVTNNDYKYLKGIEKFYDTQVMPFPADINSVLN